MNANTTYTLKATRFQGEEMESTAGLTFEKLERLERKYLKRGWDVNRIEEPLTNASKSNLNHGK